MTNASMISALNRAARAALLPTGWLLASGSAYAKQVNEAISDMSEVQQSDPGGYTLMVLCIGLLFVVAGTLIGVTTWFMMKGKKKAK